MIQDNATAVLSCLIERLSISITKQTIGEELQKHPQYNTLLALSEVLDNWHIPNAAYQLNFDDLLAAEIDGPFIAFVSQKEFVTVTNLNKTEVMVSNERWNKHHLKIEEFKKIYSGSILLAEKDEGSGEKDYSAKRRKEIINSIRIPMVIAGAAILLIGWLSIEVPYLSVLSWQIALLTLFKTAGLVTSVLLLIQSIDSNNPLLNKLCGGDNNKNCNAILSSKAAKITEELSWSEVGFFYFGGSWLVLLFNAANASVIGMLALLNLLSLPYTFYSIYHQWRIAKQWCKLCCTVQAILWLEFFTFLPSLSGGITAPLLKDFAQLITGLSTPILGWILLKPYLLLSKQIKPLKDQLRQYKYNKDLFDRMLNDQVQYALPDQDNTIIIGNSEAEKVITMVSNPYCQPCAKAHKALEWINGREDIKLQVVFTTHDETDRNAEVALHLMAMHDLNDLALKKAMDDWYEQKQKNYQTWAKTYPKPHNAVNAEALEKQREWCKITEVKGTPTLFLNGRRLPNNYQPEDIKYFI